MDPQINKNNKVNFKHNKYKGVVMIKFMVLMQFNNNSNSNNNNINSQHLELNNNIKIQVNKV